VSRSRHALGKAVLCGAVVVAVATLVGYGYAQQVPLTSNCWQGTLDARAILAGRCQRVSPHSLSPHSPLQPTASQKVTT
jgi:hypothetical protein